MPWSLSVGDWVLLGTLAAVVIGGGIVAAIRALWLYRAPAWLRLTLLSLFGGGMAVAAAGFLGGVEWLGIGGLALAVLPFGGWLVTRSIFYSGPPPGLLQGPKALDSVDDILDSVPKAVGLERSEDSDEDDA